MEHRLAHKIHDANVQMVDPGASGTITVDRSPAYVPLVSAAAETRTLARPTKTGAIATLYFLTDGGDITLTVTGGFNENGDTTFTFSDAGQFITFLSCYDGTNYHWRKIADHLGGGSTLATEAGAGITDGTDTVYRSSVQEVGGIIVTQILIDITGLHSEAVDGDIIGVDGSAEVAHLGQITAAQNGTILAGTMRCLEVPAGGDPNIALYYATEGTGVEDGAIADLTETIVFDPNADWTIDMDRSITGIPAANSYLYLVQGDATGTDADYTAGKFLITLYGYRA